jgi:hypothetical protein
LSGSSSATQLGSFSTIRFSSIGGLISGIGSMTLQVGYVANSGSTIVTSAITINSGGPLFSLASYGKVTNLNLSQASSQSLNAIFIYVAP